MNKTKTRKSAFLVAILLLLIGVIAFASTTFAKYVTSKTTTQTARVAKWGYTIEVNTTDLFGEAYNQGARVAADASSVDVKADTSGTLIVAPGTAGSMTFSISGQAEVLSKLTVTAESDKEICLTKTEDSSEYYPVKWTLKEDDSAVSGCENVTLAEIVTELNTIVSTNPVNTAIDKEYTLSWEWSFETNDADNEKDTILGLIMQGETVDGYTAVTDIAFDLTIGVEQIQNA